MHIRGLLVLTTKDLFLDRWKGKLEQVTSTAKHFRLHPCLLSSIFLSGTAKYREVDAIVYEIEFHPFKVKEATDMYPFETIKHATPSFYP